MMAGVHGGYGHVKLSMPLHYCRSRKEGGRVRCMLTVVDRGIQVSAEASSHKAAKSAAARAALKKIKAQT